MAAERPEDRETEPLIAAARWHDRLNSDPSVAERAAFDEWSRASTENALAYEAVEQAWVKTRELAAHPDILALRHETITRTVLRQSLPRRRFAMASAAALLALVMGTSLWIYRTSSAVERPVSVATAAPSAPLRSFSTQTGERLTVALEDGSQLYLDTGTTINVRYTSQIRQLVLERGQALFDVAKAPLRPFSVTVGDRIVTAYGTRFNIKHDGPTIEVALIKGSVGVDARGNPPGSNVIMQPNERLVAAGNQVSVTHYSDLGRFVSWKDGVVQFDNSSMADAVHELNRYLSSPIHIGDPEVKNIRISGSFPTGSSASFLEAVQFSFPVQAERDANGAISLQSRH